MMFRALACLFCMLIQQGFSTDGMVSKSQFHSPQFLPLNQDIVNKFHSLSWHEKIPYIFTESEWQDLVREFQLISEGTMIGYEEFVSNFAEFSDPSKVVKFWQSCDTDKDRFINIQEYASCRGNFDQNGEPYDVSEYEFREANLLENFKPIFEYDEDGIIID